MIQEWHPHPKQEAALVRTEFEVLYGGARGGGKTDTGLVWLTQYVHHPRFRALVIRKNADDLADWIDRAARMYHLLGVSIAYRPAIIRFPGGAIIRTGHLKDEQSYTKYMGQEFPRILVEELTQIPTEKRYLQLLASCRSVIPELKPQIFSTTNPGGLGHVWVKKRFVDPSPPGEPFEVDGRARVYIPATVDDNPTLQKNDPGYVLTLDALKKTDEELWKAWRMGDWNTFAGQYFQEFRTDLHTVDFFEPKAELPKYAGTDWGLKNPFVFLAAALEKVEYMDKDNDVAHFNRLWIYREIDGVEKTPQEWAKLIKDGVKLDQFDWLRADPAMFHRSDDGSRSIADQFKEQDVKFLPANNDRVGGWTAIKNWLSVAPDGLPYLIISQQCNNLITTLPSLVHDEHNVDDVNTDGDDHWADALRYMVVHIKWIDAQVGTVSRPKPQVKPPRFQHIVEPTKFR